MSQIKQKLVCWVQAIRAFSFSASIIPVLFLWVLALTEDYIINLWHVCLLLIGMVALNSAANLVNDYYDY